ncbi:MAG: class I SAM-dependent methyltransferase [Methanobrevibacter sp.]|uniref:class I SAM-dependent methyltransferase n=1 Tax=Methanobrevibacter sp. TaxID=66852 RepID=UPI001B255567|nr:class I SAM-dependent methyltransferase [Methanobrevibacter sp.]MBO5152681.1 class I SAM-dependent methyltransferase [Methanobrevibacter sp.]
MTIKKTKIIENPELLINAGNPKGKLGEELINDMNVNHENLAQWGVGHLDISKQSIILDIGCGGGVNVKRFLEMTENNVYGIDYSSVSVKKSIELNIEEIENKRCEIRQESVSQMSFDDNTFDIITAFETVYFWPDFSNDLNEVNRILKDDGIFMICNEAIPKENDERQKEFIELLNCSIYSKNELVSYLNNAGFSNIKTVINESKDSFTGEDSTWICVIAKKF